MSVHNNYINNNVYLSPQLESLKKRVEKHEPASQGIYNIFPFQEVEKFERKTSLMYSIANIKNLLNEVAESQANKIVIPVILTSNTPLLPEAWRNHNVCFLVDKTSRTIGYYDPQGGDIEKENRHLLCSKEITCAQFANMLQERLSESEEIEDDFFLVWSLESNTIGHQPKALASFFNSGKVDTSCGYRVLHFMTEVEKKSFKEVCTTNSTLATQDPYDFVLKKLNNS